MTAVDDAATTSRTDARRRAGDAPGKATRTDDVAAPSVQRQAAARPTAWATFIGNATLLIRYGELTILTDPNFVHHGADVAMGYGLTATRVTDPALDAEEVPQPDVVVLSHHHGDHFDAVAEDWLGRGVPIITTPAATRQLEEAGFGDVRPLASWESAQVSHGEDHLRVTALPAQHGTGVMAAAMPDTMGSLLELWRGPMERPDDVAPLRIYISGDTILHDGLDEIPARFPQIDVAFLHLGGNRVLGSLVSMDAVQGVELIERLRPRVAVPVHYNDYGTAQSTLAEFVAAANEAGLQDRVVYLRHGESLPLAR
ncbi:MAG TPA: MBL fold metallo-hydrolase [Candidatus Limnocylindria bacterium]